MKELREKILGMVAHVTVSGTDGKLSEWQSIDEKLLIDKSVAGASLDGSPTSFRYKVMRVPNDPRIVNDRRAWIFGEECLREQTDDIFAVDEGSRVIKEEAAVEIAIPGDAEIGAMGFHRLGRDRRVVAGTPGGRSAGSDAGHWRHLGGLCADRGRRSAIWHG